MRRFTVYRRGDLSATHNADQVNAPDQPQYEGVVFSDGTTVVRWLTAARSTSVRRSRKRPAHGAARGVAAVLRIAFLACAMGASWLYLRALDRRDEKRRAERLARWYDEHGGGHVVDD
jgi:hypothetical protein